MNYSKLFDYQSFGFWDTDPYIELCYNLAYKKLDEMYPDSQLLACDCFGISIIKNNKACCEEVASYSTGRLGKAGPLAMRNEVTKEVHVLCLN